MFRIRCSAIGSIVGGALNKPTEKQLQELEMLEAKAKRTELQEKKLQELIAKRDTPPGLSEGAKTYCELWLKEQLYGRTKEFSSKYTEKGVECEQAAIELFAEMNDLGMIGKNTTRYFDDYMEGEPDLVLTDLIADIKCPWDFSTFPLFEDAIPNSDYFWQLQGYMHLTGIKKAKLAYCLMDAPDYLIELEARKASFAVGKFEVESELYDEVYDRMTYGKINKKLKYKCYDVDYDPAMIEVIQNRVIMCREYIDKLLEKTSSLISSHQDGTLIN